MTKSDIPQVERTQISVDLPIGYVHLNKRTDTPLLILLHGYSDSGPSFLRRIVSSLNDRYEVLAPNGFFPLPQRVENEWKEAYAWYFADFEKNRILISPEVAAKGVARLVENLGLQDRPKILCGFSQGGFFVPRLAKHLTNLQHFIVIGGGFPIEDYLALESKISVTALHGIDDDVVKLTQAKAQYEKLEKSQRHGFHEIRHMDHIINEDGREKLKQILAELV